MVSGKESLNKTPLTLVGYSPAKLNLYLQVGDKSDKGRHYLHSIVVPLKLYDTVSILKTEEGMRCDLSLSNSLVKHIGERAGEIERELSDQSNLAFKAADRFFQETSISQSIEIKIEKRIPLQAGLGGGSSNAATVLLLLNQMYGGVLSQDKLLKIAGRIGSDVPAFVLQSPAILSETGEVVVPTVLSPKIASKSLILIKPQNGVSTETAYKGLNRSQGKPLTLLPELANSALAAVEDLKFRNDFEVPLQQEPWFQKATTELRRAGAQNVLLAGSGSSVAGFFEPAAVRIAEAALRSVLNNWWVQGTELLVK